jgi:cyclopropane fatty-acyl-phospholipid synthase-like methyltransferase
MISNKGYWIGTEASSQHCYDPRLSEALCEFFQRECAGGKIVDLGCGMGNYVKYFRSKSLNSDGFDGNPNTPTLTDGACGIRDLSEPFRFDEPYDWVMSLEVGEHLPKQFESTFIENLHNNNKHGILLSWAVVGQGGHGHVNERNNDYIRGRMSTLGYVSDEKAEAELRAAATLSWFKRTIMVFRRA